MFCLKFTMKMYLEFPRWDRKSRKGYCIVSDAVINHWAWKRQQQLEIEQRKRWVIDFKRRCAEKRKQRNERERKISQIGSEVIGEMSGTIPDKNGTNGQMSGTNSHMSGTNGEMSGTIWK